MRYVNRESQRHIARLLSRALKPEDPEVRERIIRGMVKALEENNGSPVPAFGEYSQTLNRS